MGNKRAGFRQAVRLVALCLVLAASGAAQARDSSQELTARVDEYINGLVKANQFSGAVLVARDGRVLVSKGYGFANLEDETPNTPQTRFRLGSITKQFTATAIMMLEERGKLSAQDSICKYVEDCPQAWQAVTIRHLLSHTSGVPNFTSFPEYPKTMTQPATVDSLIARFKDKPLDFQPGERWSYSNSGYVLLGHVIEKLSGKSYEAFLQENIFDPLKMTNTGYDSPARIIKHRAAGYMPRGNVLINAPYLDMTIPHAAGALYSTVEDLYLWDQALYTERLISKKSFDAMFTPVKNDYGYGWGISKQYGLTRISHGGGINGFVTYISRYPEAKAVVVVLSNFAHANPQAIATELAKMALADKMTLPAGVKVDPAALKNYAGRYQVDPKVVPNLVLDVTIEDGQLWVKPSGEKKRKVIAISDSVFWDEEMENSRLTFSKDEKGGVAGINIESGSMKFTARRLTLPPPSLKGNTTFRLKGYPDARVVALAGTFNNWNQSQTLFAREGDGWVCRVDLLPGRYTYKFVVDGNWMVDPANPASEDDGGGNTNSVLVVK
jgi:CubicO group peptidase (beta-lactamase class C family)